MSVESAKAKLDAQPGDPATGYISKADHQDSYTELVDDTALTGATTAEALTISGNLNGRDPDNLVTGPASATDNALTRFDGTGGKTVQNSGITVDDSGNVTSDLKVSKATALLVNNSTSGASYVEARGTAATWRGFRFLTGSSVRFGLYVTDEPESGSNAGSNFGFYRATDAASESTNVLVTRSTGKWSFRDVGATAGLELGTSGPRIMSGTGSPEGVVTAPVGSQWIDTAATTGAVAWRKASGTGSTGWKVEYGDTGSRNIAALADSIGTLTLSTWALRRIGQVVTMWLIWADSQTTPSRVTLGTLPSGFRPEARFYMGVPYDTAVTSLYRNVYVDSGGDVQYGGPTTASAFRMQATWTTANAWPAVLPGS